MTLVVWIAVIVGFILFGLGICFLMWKCCKGKEKNRDAERNSGGVYFDAEEKSNDNKPSIQPGSEIDNIFIKHVWLVFILTSASPIIQLLENP